MEEVRAPMALVEDDVVHVKVEGRLREFRIRIWRARAEFPLVFVTPIGDFLTPLETHCKIANLVHAVYLGYTDPAHAHPNQFPVNYWTTYTFDGWQWVGKIFFKRVGHSLRRHAFHPREGCNAKEELEQLIGQTVDL